MVLIDDYHHCDMTRTMVLGEPAGWQQKIHEAPALSQLGVGIIAAGMAVTVEPGGYLAGRSRRAH